MITYLTSFFLLVAGLLLVSEKVAHAYLDPGLGSYLFQVFASVVIGIVLFFKQIKNFIMYYIFRKK